MFIDTKDHRAITATAAIKSGDTAALTILLKDHPELATAYLGTEDEGRTLVHILTDWPGFLPENIKTLHVLLDAGANINAEFAGKAHSETPLHWAASNDDVAVLDALLDAGADIDAGGGVIDETPLSDARAFLQLKCAKRLVERGARVSLQDASTLGLMDRVGGFYEGSSRPSQHDTDCAFWNACHGGQLETAQYLHAKGAEVNKAAPWEELTPLDAAKRSKADELVLWLQGLGAVRFEQLKDTSTSQ